MMFTYCSNLMFLVSLHGWKYVDFQTGHFAEFEPFKVDILLTFGKSKYSSPLVTLDRSQLFY